MTKLQVRVNGIHAAWPALFGGDNAHADEVRADPYRIANVSFSLLQWDGDRLARHTLIDAGLGVVQSLLELEAARGVHVIHEVLVTHPHFDHFAHLDWIAASVHRNGRANQPRPLPVYCTPPCWEIGPDRVFPWMTQKGRLVHVAIAAGRAFELGRLRVTPMEVQHSVSAPGAVGFVVEPIDPPPGTPRKLVFTGDFLSLPNAGDPLWHDADVCFLESNTWNPNPQTGHQCILDGVRLTERWRTKHTYLVHYSGFEDTAHEKSMVNRSLTYPELAEAIAKVRGTMDIRVARHGMILPDDEPWPA